MPPKNIIRSVEPKWQLFQLEKDLILKNLNPIVPKKQVPEVIFSLHSAHPRRCNAVGPCFFSTKNHIDSDSPVATTLTLMLAATYFSIWPAKAKPISVKDNSSEKNTSICGRKRSHDLPTLLWIYILNVEGSSFINGMFWHISLDCNNKRTKSPRLIRIMLHGTYIYSWYFTSAGSSFKVTKLQDSTRWEASTHIWPLVTIWSRFVNMFEKATKKKQEDDSGWPHKKLSISS